MNTHKIVTGAVIALLAVACAADELKIDQKYIMTPEQAAEHRRKMDMKRFGGLVRKANSASGKVVFLNAQKIVPVSSLKGAFDEIDREIHPLWEVKSVPSVKLSNPADDIKNAGAKVGVVLADSADLPALLVAPESGWAIVNVAALKTTGCSDDVLAHRVRVELLRAFALAGGCSFMARDAIALKPGVRIPDDLDLIKDEEFGIDVKAVMERGLSGFGVIPWKQVSYRQACKEGWASSPTNDFQRKIWDKVHALPSNPIKIKYDPKRDK